ncbi:MAG: Fic family protein [Coriobacteriia bacterium]|nr:Fic family protein [Coriobacteriia bacterium]MCL2750308.1 Fic family protein [Coriobacteriia bacterium]
MGTFHQEYWVSDGMGQTRAERKSGAYSYYVPTKLSALEIQLDSDVVADIVRAEKALLEIDSYSGRLSDLEGLSHFLLRAEAISSSFIEGLQMGAKRLLQAELNTSEPHAFKADETAEEILGNINALKSALELAGAENELKLKDITRIHKLLLGNTPAKEYAGEIRVVQNWIGGNSYNPLTAAHVPPAPEILEDLMDDLLQFSNRHDVSPVQQAALAHAQFETIHPFVDGNGRSGRAFIHMILRKRGLLKTFVPPISLILAAYPKSYIAGLNSIRYDGEQPDDTAYEAINEWLSFFAGSCVRACNEVKAFGERAEKLEAQWRTSLGAVRKNSALDALLGKLMGIPVFTANSASKVIGRSFQATNPAIERLVEVGIAKPYGSARRNRAYEVPSALDVFRALERQLASPASNTHS